MMLFTDSSSQICRRSSWGTWDLDGGDAALFRQLFTDRLQVIVGAARIAETPGAAPVVKETAENTEVAYLIVRTANVAETPGAAPVVKEAAGNVEGAS